MISKGFTMSFARDFRHRMVRELLHYKMPLKQKIWAIRHGFFPSNVDLYKFGGFNKKNYSDYLRDFDYYRLYPLNNFFRIWIDDKITTKYVFQDTKFKDFMPRYFIYIERDGRYSYLMDYNEKIPKDQDALMNLLKAEKVLAVKPLAGSGGYGFMKLEYDEGSVFSNGKVLSLADFEIMKQGLKGYIVTEYCYQHSFLRNIWPDSECTLRIVTARIPEKFGGGKCKTFVTYARIGTSISGATSNLSQGGIAAPFDFETGIFADHLFRHLRFEPNGQLTHECHPDTKVRIAGKKLPNWDMVKKFIIDFTNYLSSLNYFGFDVIITEDGFKICEINSHPVIDIEQVMFQPVMKDDFMRSFFESRLLKMS